MQDDRHLHAYDTDAPSLADAFRGKLRIGAAINSWHLDPASREYATLTKQFAVFTLENESKPAPIHPEMGRYVFEPVDRFAAFGEETGATLRGHTLVWHNQSPMWLFRDEAGGLVSKEVLLSRMEEHITTVVSRYAGRIATWDVVNEVLRDEGGLRESLWYQIAGEDYIAAAFRAAHRADPAARLIINDYNLESSDAKADTMLALVKKLLAGGVPVHGIGLQMHLSLWTDLERLQKNVEKLAALREICPDFKLEVTELDLSCYAWNDEATDIDWTAEKTAAFTEKYTELFRYYTELAARGVLDTVVFWGLSDGHSWLNGFPRRHTNYPLLIGRDYLVKDAMHAVCALGDAAKETETTEG